MLPFEITPTTLPAPRFLLSLNLPVFEKNTPEMQWHCDVPFFPMDGAPMLGRRAAVMRRVGGDPLVGSLRMSPDTRDSQNANQISRSLRLRRP